MKAGIVLCDFTRLAIFTPPLLRTRRATKHNFRDMTAHGME
jgi:hypothetical protein